MTAEYQIPSIPKMIGISKTFMTWKTKVRIKEIAAEVTPSLRAVKNPELNDTIPISVKARAKIRKPWIVNSKIS